MQVVFFAIDMSHLCCLQLFAPTGQARQQPLLLPALFANFKQLPPATFFLGSAILNYLSYSNFVDSQVLWLLHVGILTVCATDRLLCAHW